MKDDERTYIPEEDGVEADPMDDAPEVEDTEDAGKADVVETSAEDKHEKFKEISMKRMQRAGKVISSIGDCARKGSYEYTEAEVEKMFDFLQEALDESHRKFLPKPEFSWD